MLGQYLKLERRSKFGLRWSGFNRHDIELNRLFAAENTLKREVTGIARFEDWMKQIHALEKKSYGAVWDKLWEY
jgi:hypothetical protein